MGIDVTGLGSVAELVGKIADKVWPDPAERDKAKLAIFEAQQAGEFKEMDQALQLATGQMDVNKVEAASTSLLVSGGRPFCIWVGGVALAYASILEPLLRFGASVGFGYHGAFPVLDTTVTTQVLMGLLGLGAMRSVDKFNGVARK